MASLEERAGARLRPQYALRTGLSAEGQKAVLCQMLGCPTDIHHEGYAAAIVLKSKTTIFSGKVKHDPSASSQRKATKCRKRSRCADLWTGLVGAH